MSSTHLNLEFLTHLKHQLPFKKISMSNNEMSLTVDANKIKPTLQFLKSSHTCQYSVLTALSGADYPQKLARFDISYDLLSLAFNSRIRVKTQTDEVTPLLSVTSLYRCVDWYERELWDLFGIFFTDHPDLRRILTDYGFEGHPLRKDFPLSGYIEVRYDERKKRVVCEPLSLAQEFRTFDFKNPWD
jgi:NADH/F420H2 dehydrogenase subunit C